MSVNNNHKRGEIEFSWTRPFQEFYGGSIDGLCIVDSQGRFRSVNPAYSHLLGYSREEFLTMSVSDIERQETPKEMSKSIKSIVTSDKTRFETHYRHRDGRIVDVEISATGLIIANEPFSVFLVRDITERKQAEEELRRSEREKTIILENMSELVTYQDAQRRILWANRALCKAFGLSLEQMIGHYCYEVMAQRNEPCVDCPAVKVHQTGQPQEAEMTGPDGRVWFIRSYPVLDKRGDVGGVIDIALDITQRKQVEDALRENEERYRILSEAAFEGIAIHHKGKILEVNKTFAEISGYAPSELIGMTALELTAPESRDLLMKNIHSGYEKPYQINGLRKDGSTRRVELCGKAVHYQGGIMRVVAMRDITEKRKMEEEFLRIEKLESTGVLAGGIAHDFNNILTAILGNISLAKMNTNPGDKIFESLTESEKACLRARDLTKQLLTFSKGGAPIRKMTTMAELIKESASFALRGSNVRCEFSIPDVLWPVEVDDGQISLVINNLIINADQAMPKGGIIEVCAENITAPPEDILPLKEGKYIKIFIKDQGIGISKEYLPKIFDPYFTTKQKGSGLGLATSYAIIKNHDGYITVESKLGAGTTFFIYLPAPEKGVLISKDVEGKPLTGKGKILVMDDEKMVRDVARAMLIHIGYEVEFACDGAEAISLYEQRKEAGCPFDVVIMDLTVPGGMGGKDAIDKLLEIDPGVKAIVSSGYSHDPIMTDFKQYGFSGVMAKPYKMQELSEVLHTVMKAS